MFNKRELKSYAITCFFSATVFGLCYAYLRFLGIPQELNKSAADTSIILMGLSMLASSLSYFSVRLRSIIFYRKELGLVGFAFALAHFLLSWSAFTNLLQLQTWQAGKMFPALTGLLALVIFTIMAAVSNTYAARSIGGKNWRYVLRTGYIAILFVVFHVALLKSARWITWFQGGMQTLPSLSLLVTVFMIVVLVMRGVLWWSLRRNEQH